MEGFKLDKTAAAPPAYLQILDFVETQIRTRRLRAGDRLPAERDLALRLRTARGTVKRAYEELVRRGLVEAAQGRGSFVAAAVDLPAESRKEKAIRLIDQLIDQLAALKFGAGDIRTFVELRLLGREDELRSLSVALVDCNPEALAIFEKQCQLILDVGLARILLDDVLEDPGAAARLASFDLILTTTTHYRDLVERFPEIKAKLVQAAVAPTRQSIVSLARLSPSRRIGIVCESPRFQAIIREHLRSFDVPDGAVAALPAAEIDRLGAFVADLDAVIVPAGFSLQRHREHLAALQAFTERGGRVVSFDYQIERGSLLHLQERLRSVLDERIRSAS